jgi:hypothetical protein
LFIPVGKPRPRPSDAIVDAYYSATSFQTRESGEGEGAYHCWLVDEGIDCNNELVRLIRVCYLTRLILISAVALGISVRFIRLINVTIAKDLVWDIKGDWSRCINTGWIKFSQNDDEGINDIVTEKQISINKQQKLDTGRGMGMKRYDNLCQMSELYVIAR